MLKIEDTRLNVNQPPQDTNKRVLVLFLTFTQITICMQQPCETRVGENEITSTPNSLVSTDRPQLGSRTPPAAARTPAHLSHITCYIGGAMLPSRPSKSPTSRRLARQWPLEERLGALQEGERSGGQTSVSGSLESHVEGRRSHHGLKQIDKPNVIMPVLIIFVSRGK